MTRGVRFFLVGCLVLVALSGCGRGFMTAEREPWRAEAEKACMKSGAIKETAELVLVCVSRSEARRIAVECCGRVAVVKSSH